MTKAPQNADRRNHSHACYDSERSSNFLVLYKVAPDMSFNLCMQVSREFTSYYTCQIKAAFIGIASIPS